MSRKEQQHGGVKLTAKTARTLAMQEFGTARGLTKSTSFVGAYFMEFGNLRIEICADAACIAVRVVLAHGTGSSVKYFDPDTLQENFKAKGHHDRLCNHAAERPGGNDNQGPHTVQRRRNCWNCPVCGPQDTAIPLQRIADNSYPTGYRVGGGACRKRAHAVSRRVHCTNAKRTYRYVRARRFKAPA